MTHRKGFLIVFWGSSIGGVGGGGGVSVVSYYILFKIYKNGSPFDGLEYYDSHLLIKWGQCQLSQSREFNSLKIMK